MSRHKLMDHVPTVLMQTLDATCLSFVQVADSSAAGSAGDTMDEFRIPRLPPLILRSLDVADSATVPDLRRAAEQCGGKPYLYDPLLKALHERLCKAAELGMGESAPPLRMIH